MVSIPDEIIFYRSGSSIPVTNGEIITSESELNQDKTKIKYNKNYTLDYQFMALGKANYREIYEHAYDTKNWIKICGDCNYYDESSRYQQLTYYGRTNRLTFRICHDYCETCKEL